jgi:2'-5' RNA ligase
VVWLGVGRGAERFCEVARAVEDAVRGAGFEPDARPFRAHVTVARLDRPADVSGFVERHGAVRIPFAVREVVLYESKLGRGPPVYERLATYVLGERS